MSGEVVGKTFVDRVVQIFTHITKTSDPWENEAFVDHEIERAISIAARINTKISEFIMSKRPGRVL